MVFVLQYVLYNVFYAVMCPRGIAVSLEVPGASRTVVLALITKSLALVGLAASWVKK